MPELIDDLLIELARLDDKLESAELAMKAVKLVRDDIKSKRDNIDECVRKIALEQFQSTGDIHPHTMVSIRRNKEVEFPKDTYENAVQNGSHELLKIRQESEKEVIRFMLEQTKGELLELDEKALKKVYQDYSWLKVEEVVKYTAVVKKPSGIFYRNSETDDDIFS